MTREEAIKQLRSNSEVFKTLKLYPVLVELIDIICESPWISVKDRLPEVDKDRKWKKVFVRFSNRDVDVAYYSPVGGFSFSISFYHEYIANNVTHWMPIPELPKEE